MSNSYEFHEELSLPPQLEELLEPPLTLYKFSIKNGYVIYLSNIGKIDDFQDIRENSLGYL